VRRAIDQRGGQRLASQPIDVDSFLFADMHGVRTWRLSVRGVHSSGSDLNVLPIAEQPAKKTFCHRAPANISCANKKDAFHDSKPARCRFAT
jgi:hypothetical protein